MRTALLALALLPASSACAAELRAGLARVEITPSVSMQMYGYSNRKCGPSNGTHDPLFAKALVLAAGGTRMAIVTLDLGSIVSDRLRRDVAEKLGIPVLLLAASHTHSAPSFLPYGSSPAEGEPASTYLRELEQKIFGAISTAASSLFPARLSVARGSLQLGYNRLLLRADGRARALFDNLERIPYGPVDPEFVLLRVEDASGAGRALLVHYATHAVVLGPTNCKYSADYPGVLQARLEHDLPGTQVMFVQGGAGDVNPLFMARSGKEDEDFNVVQKMGETLAGEVLAATKKFAPLPSAEASIAYRSEVLTYHNRWDKDATLEVGITTVLINGTLAIAAVPGEPMHKLQKMWKSEADVPVPLFYGYTYSSGGTWPGYLPDLRSAAYGGYGADVSTTIETGAGERIIQRNLMQLYDLRGMWRSQPGKP